MGKKFKGIALTAEEIDKQGDFFPSKLVEKIDLKEKLLLLEFDTKFPIGKILNQKITERGLEIEAELIEDAFPIKVGDGIGIGGMIKMGEHIPVDGGDPIYIVTEFEPLYVSIVSIPAHPKWVVTEIIDSNEEEPKDL